MSEPATTRRDLLGGAITVAAIIMFVGTGSAALSMIVSNYLAGKGGNDQTLVIAMLLNVALILFGWRRHRELSRELVGRIHQLVRGGVDSDRLLQRCLCGSVGHVDQIPHRRWSISRRRYRLINGGVPVGHLADVSGISGQENRFKLTGISERCAGNIEIH